MRRSVIVCTLRVPPDPPCARCKVLSFIDEEAAERGEPELAVLVVRQSDGLPGQGWWIGGAKKYGYKGLWDGPKAAKLIRKVQALAYDYWAGREQ